MRDLTVCEIESVSGGSIIEAALTGIGAVAGGALGTVVGIAAAVLTGVPAYIALLPAGVAVGGLAGLALGTVIGIVI